MQYSAPAVDARLFPGPAEGANDFPMNKGGANLRATRRDEPVSLAGRLADTGDKTIMLYAIVLICGLSTPHLNCDETTAHRYERVPGCRWPVGWPTREIKRSCGNELPFMCQRSAEIWAAEHVEIKADEYPKIRCSRHEFGSRVG